MAKQIILVEQGGQAGRAAPPAGQERGQEMAISTAGRTADPWRQEPCAKSSCGDTHWAAKAHYWHSWHHLPRILTPDASVSRKETHDTHTQQSPSSEIQAVKKIFGGKAPNF